MSFNALESLKRCIASVFATTTVPYELIIVDNGSSEAVRTYLEQLKHIAGLRVALNVENLGFAKGSNQALELAQGDLVLFLNSDTIVTPKWLDNLVQCLEHDSSVGAVGPRSNHASGIQGGIFIDDMSPEGVERFSRSFNWSDPRRWYPVELLSGYALLVRHSVLSDVGGFDERFAIGTAEDRELCQRVIAAGHLLYCAGDTFIFHEGHRSFLENQLDFVEQQNRNRALLEGRPASAEPLEGEVERQLDGLPPVSLVMGSGRARYRWCDGRLSAISEGEAVKILFAAARPVRLDDAVIAAAPKGPPTFFIRGYGPTVYLAVDGLLREIKGDPQRIRLLHGITVVSEDELADLPRGETLSADVLEPPAAVPQLLPYSGVRDFEHRFLSMQEVNERVADAIRYRKGLSIIRIGSGEAVVLNQGIFPHEQFNTDYCGVPLPNEEFRREFIEAIRDASIVGLSPNRQRDYCAPLIERLFDCFHIYPREICSAFVNWDLVGLDRDTGEPLDTPGPLCDLLKQVRVALVGRAAIRGDAAKSRLGFEPVVTVGLDGASEVPKVLEYLKTRSEEFDLALVAAGVPADVLCVRLAKELNKVAIDFGHALNRMLDVRFNEYTMYREKLCWRAERYLKQVQAGAVASPAHPLDGEFIRTPARKTFYVEDGILRHVPSQRVLELFDARVLDVKQTDIDGLAIGLPLCLVQSRLSGPCLLKDRKLYRVSLDIEVVPVDEALLANIEPVSDLQLTWRRTPTRFGRRSAKSSHATSLRGAFLARTHDGDAFFVEGWEKRPIASLDALDLLKRLLGRPIFVPRPALGGYKLGALPLFAADGRGQVWLLRSQCRHLVPGEVEAESLPESVIGALPRGFDLPGASGGRRSGGYQRYIRTAMKELLSVLTPDASRSLKGKR